MLLPERGEHLGVERGRAGRRRAGAALQALERAGLLRIEYGGVTVPDPAALAAYPDRIAGRTDDAVA